MTQDNVTTIILFIILSLVALLAVLMVSFFISDKADTKRFLKEREMESNAENRLTFALKGLCNLLNIPLSFHEELGTAAGQILYYTDSDGKLILNDVKIQILNKYMNDPWVLAHELGHYMAIKQREDNTEDGANKEALVLCKTILTQDEQESLEVGLRVYFGKQD